MINNFIEEKNLFIDYVYILSENKREIQLLKKIQIVSLIVPVV